MASNASCTVAVEMSCKTSLGNGNSWYISRGETFWFNGLPKPEGIKVFPRLVAVGLKLHGLCAGICIFLASSHLQRSPKCCIQMQSH